MKSLLTFCCIVIFFIACLSDKEVSTINTPTPSIKNDTINGDYWLGCETGQGDCTPLTFYRDTTAQKWVLVMPCAGSETTVFLSKEGVETPIDSKSVAASECPPIFELTDLEDGQYEAYMLGCNLGGGVRFSLVTKS